MQSIGKILDIGSGTGLLSLMLAQKVDASIDALELDKDAFNQAKENIAASPWEKRITIFNADAREFEFPYQYDIIISNPPFYENELKSPDPKRRSAHHEGLPLNDLLTIIKKNLAPGGVFYLLLPYKRKVEIDTLFTPNQLCIFQKTMVKQSLNHDYFRFMISGGHIEEEKEMIVNEISIRNDKEQYTEEFISLLKDYYLNLASSRAAQ